ncbi:loricrin-like [Helianthus annuus]|uniref:loricrin-like n=1 Tax=Helianthus annuus TaxID=4232 RepID=UPI000B90905B|nr:loricrin-like [Helianthus annuus]
MACRSFTHHLFVTAVAIMIGFASPSYYTRPCDTASSFLEGDNDGGGGEVAEVPNIVMVSGGSDGRNRRSGGVGFVGGYRKGSSSGEGGGTWKEGSGGQSCRRGSGSGGKDGGSGWGFGGGFGADPDSLRLLTRLLVLIILVLILILLVIVISRAII